MSRYTIQVGNLEPKENHGEDYFEVAYGFDTGGLLGQKCPNFGFFLQAWLMAECGYKEPTYYASGDKTAIMESPFWDDIQKSNPDHAMKIALDLPF